MAQDDSQVRHDRCTSCGATKGDVHYWSCPYAPAKEKIVRRDGLQMGRFWQWGLTPTKAELSVWETNRPCDPGDVTLIVDILEGRLKGNIGYIRLTPEQQKTFGEWLLDKQRVCLNCGKSAPCMTEADLKQEDPGVPCTFDPTPAELFRQSTLLRGKVKELERERDEWRSLARDLDKLTDEYDALTDSMEDEVNKLQVERNAMTRDRDGWRREASTLAWKKEDLEHEVGELKEKLRQLKHYINSLYVP